MLADSLICHETIYNAIYALLTGELCKELSIARVTENRRVSHARAVWTGATKYPAWPHLRPSEASVRILPSHWEGDLIKGKNDTSAVGTLVAPTTGYLMLVKTRRSMNYD